MANLSLLTGAIILSDNAVLPALWWEGIAVPSKEGFSLGLFWLRSSWQGELSWVYCSKHGLATLESSSDLSHVSLQNKTLL